jgi:hypothetical protein
MSILNVLKRQKKTPSQETKIKKPFPWETVQLVVALVLALLAFGIFGYWALSIVDKSEQINVVVAARKLDAPRILVADDVKQERIRRDAVPATAIAEVEDAVGLTLLRSLSPQEYLTTTVLIAERDPGLAGFAIDVGLHGFVLPLSWLAAPMPNLKKDDLITILVSGQSADGGALNTGVIANGVPVAGVTRKGDGPVQDILLPLDLPTAAQLVQARADKFLLTVIVNGIGGSETNDENSSTP